jgi:hypothetical protein
MEQNRRISNISGRVTLPNPLSRLLTLIIYSLKSSGEERNLQVKTLKMFYNASKYSSYTKISWSIESITS